MTFLHEWFLVSAEQVDPPAAWQGGTSPPLAGGLHLDLHPGLHPGLLPGLHPDLHLDLLPNLGPPLVRAVGQNILPRRTQGLQRACAPSGPLQEGVTKPKS